MKNIAYNIFIFIILISCKTNKPLDENKNIPIVTSKEISKKNIENIADTTFVNLKDYDKNFVYDMKYATTDNFLKAKLYDCAECFLRYKAVKALVIANNLFLEKGFKIKLYDCYRPLDIQKKMFKIVPNPKYVANPAKGSIHNKGGAVDISLVDKNGVEVDMGTKFDFFGEEASHNYTNLSKSILKSRIFLKEIMEKANFKAIEPEWWHYNLIDAQDDKVSNNKWKCD